MAHIIRPIYTISATPAWVPFAAATLWEAVDEVTPDDTDYAQVTGNLKWWRLRFSPGTDNGIHTGHILRWRMRRHAIAIRMTVDLWQDDAHLFGLGVHLFLGPPNIFYDYTITLTAFQAAMITNYETLGLHLQSSNFNPTNKGDISWVELELPGAAWTVPIVQTDPATSVESTAATLNGTLNEQGLEACACGFEYGETTDYGSTTATQSKTTGESFSQEVLGLRYGGILYHFRAIATNSAGTRYGADRTFHTEALSAEAHQALGKGYALGRAGL